MQRKLKFAIVGAGAIAQAYAKAFSTSPFASVAGVVDVRLDAARRLASAFGARAFDSHVTLLQEQDFDAALICTPPATHCAIALELLQHGKHILCEKPLSVDVASAQRMLSAGHEAGVKITMSSKFRYVEDVAQTKRFLETGVIGEVLSLENAFTSRVYMGKDWHCDPALSGGGVIIDNGTHSVDIVRFLCGPIVTIAASEAARSQRLPVEDTAHMVARTTSNVLATIDLSWSLNKQSDSYIRVCGSEGTLSLDWSGSKYSPVNGGACMRFGKGYDKVQALGAQLDNFCLAVDDEEPLSVTAEDALASVETVAAAYRSLREHRWVAVAPEEVFTSYAAPDLAAAAGS